MKLRIEKEFRDKFTGEKYNAGDAVEFEDSRAEELLADQRNLVSEIKEKTTPKKPARKAKK